jgi:hypothetical protein
MSKARSPRESCSITIGITVTEGSPSGSRTRRRCERAPSTGAGRRRLSALQSERSRCQMTHFDERRGTPTLLPGAIHPADQGSSGAAGSDHQREFNHRQSETLPVGYSRGFSKCGSCRGRVGDGRRRDVFPRKVGGSTPSTRSRRGSRRKPPSSGSRTWRSTSISSAPRSEESSFPWPR